MLKNEAGFCELMGDDQAPLCGMVASLRASIGHFIYAAFVEPNQQFFRLPFDNAFSVFLSLSMIYAQSIFSAFFATSVVLNKGIKIVELISGIRKWATGIRTPISSNGMQISPIH